MYIYNLRSNGSSFAGISWKRASSNDANQIVTEPFKSSVLSFSLTRLIN